MILGLFEDDNEGFLGNQQVFMIGLTQNDQKNFISYYSFLFFRALAIVCHGSCVINFVREVDVVLECLVCGKVGAQHIRSGSSSSHLSLHDFI